MAEQDLKDLLRSTMLERFGVDDYDPLVRAVAVAESNQGSDIGQISPRDLVNVHLKIAEYWHPKKKSVQLSDPRGEAVKVELISRIRQALD